jgi:hypothetical protein
MHSLKARVSKLLGSKEEEKVNDVIGDSFTYTRVP